MSARPKHRDAIVQAAVRLFRRQGYCATGLNEIVEFSGAPKGSVYHYFPGGKAAIAVAAVEAAGKSVADTLRRLSEDSASAGALIVAFAATLAGWMKQSEFRSGSPITTVLLETAPDNAAVTAAGHEAFASWRGILGARLIEDGALPARARRLAALALNAIEGALIQARVERSGAPLETAGAELKALFEAALAQGPRGSARPKRR